MKKSKILKMIVIILLIILLSIISFGGIFVENKNTMKNLIPDYKLSRELTGSRRVQLDVDKSVETIKYDENGNKIEDSSAEGIEVVSTEEISKNKEEVLTVENYKKSKKIIEKRLNDMQVNDYTIRLNEENGTMILEFPEDDNTDLVISQLRKQGKLEIIDSDSKEILMTNDDIKNISAGIGNVSSGYIAFMQIQFNKEGTEKFKSITNTYIETEDSEGNKTEKKITLKMDDEEIMSTTFDEEISNGILQLTVGSASTNANSEELQTSYISVVSDAEVLNSGKTPIVYITGQNKYVQSEITSNSLNTTIYIGIAIIVLGMIYIIIKYKKLGILSSISLIGYIALLLIAIRYTNVEISISGICALALSIIINYISNIIMLNKFKEIENRKIAFTKSIIKTVMMIIPAYIVAIVFTLFNSSFGAVLFWGLSIILLYNYVITRTLIIEE